MTALIAPLLGCICEGLKLLNTESARKYIVEVAEIRQDLVDEKSKGQAQDDLKIERLYAKLKITLDLVQAEFQLASAKSK